MIEISINNALGELSERLNSFDKSDLCKEVATNIVPLIRVRVHVEGKASDGSPIGTYSKGYMRVRTGNYPETIVVKGKNAGQYRERKKKGQAGVFTKGRNQGQPRPTYNRSTDTKVILSLTSQMEQDLKPIQTDNGYGIGYSNEFNYNKAVWNEKRYKKDIWNLSVDELNTMESISENYIKKILND